MDGRMLARFGLTTILLIALLGLHPHSASLLPQFDKNLQKTYT